MKKKERFKEKKMGVNGRQTDRGRHSKPKHSGTRRMDGWKRGQGCWSWPELATQVLPATALNCFLTNFRASLLQAAPKRLPPAISGWHRKATYVRCMLLREAPFTSLCLSLWRCNEGENKERTEQLEAPGRS